MHPPIFFGLAKENGPCTVQKKNAGGRNFPHWGKIWPKTGAWQSVQWASGASTGYAVGPEEQRWYRPASGGMGGAFGAVIEWNCRSFRCRFPDVPPDRSISPFPADQLVQGNVVKIRKSDQRGQHGFPLPTFICLIGTPADADFLRKLCLLQASLFSQAAQVLRKSHSSSFSIDRHYYVCYDIDYKRTLSCLSIYFRRFLWKIISMFCWKP